jgi:hypothetical protein
VVSLLTHQGVFFKLRHGLVSFEDLFKNLHVFLLLNVTSFGQTGHHKVSFRCALTKEGLQWLWVKIKVNFLKQVDCVSVVTVDSLNVIELKDFAVNFRFFFVKLSQLLLEDVWVNLSLLIFDVFVDLVSEHC